MSDVTAVYKWESFWPEVYPTPPHSVYNVGDGEIGEIIKVNCPRCFDEEWVCEDHGVARFADQCGMQMPCPLKCWLEVTADV